MSKHRTRGTRWNRLLSGVLCLALMLGLLPTTGLIQPAEAANWAEPYAQQLVEWGVMTPNLATNLGSAITRAEFVAMCNRAFGYKRLGGTPFVDVPSSAWYAEDIDIAYNAGYFTGTSADPANPKASPNGTMTKEMAAVAVARNLMLQETVGESLGFTDSRDLHEWSRGLIGAAVAEGVITGLPDGSFRPFNNITRGEVAALLVRLIGTPINKEGSYELGDVYGNVVISSSNVTLRDTVILGNLYVTGGVDLGNVLLENVTVLGKIVISGGGESHAAQSSVILRNVEADEMLVDSIIDQFVTISAYGVTDIPFTSVRTDAYVEDSCEAGYGLHLIELDGEAGTLLQLSGDIKEVVNKTPFSDLQLVRGTAQTITVDEYARGSQVLLSEGTLVYEMNLDVATLVMGKGDIRDLNISAAGCEVEILPEHVTLRPGITATVDGQVIGDLEAAEMSSEPRLLAGYPAVTSIAPTQAEGLFAANKPGTIYWAISELADGSVSVDDLISNPAYGGNIYKDNAGSISANSKTEYGRQISSLVPDGSYYISAVMVDGRGQVSPLKVAAFTTPDDTVPAFVDGYPYMSKTTCDIAQVTAMPNKSCLLYYALLPQGAAAPTPQEFKSGSIGGNYGYGSVNVVKNVPVSITVNRSRLQEKTTYWLYLWLTDHNGAQSMAAPVRLEFTTPDETPPIVSAPIQTDAGDVWAEVSFQINEYPASLYWAVVTESNVTFISEDADMSSLRTKLKVESGANSIVHGETPVTGANVDATILKTILTGLSYEDYGTHSFKFYYVAKDADGNYSDEVRYITIHTLDTDPPHVWLTFSDAVPRANSDVRLVFDEQVKGGSGATKTFLELYEAVEQYAKLGADYTSQLQNAKNELAKALGDHIKLYSIPKIGSAQLVTPVTDAQNQSGTRPEGWVLDWHEAIVTMSQGNVVITLPGEARVEEGLSLEKAINLDSGATYEFRLRGVFDNAETPNGIAVDADGYTITEGSGVLNDEGNGIIPRFTTAYAQVVLYENTSVDSMDNGDDKGFRLDVVVDVKPESTEKVPADQVWDMIMWSDTIMTVDIYRKVIDLDNNGNETDSGTWELVRAGVLFSSANEGRGLFAGTPRSQYEAVKDGLEEGKLYRYGIHITHMGEEELDEDGQHTIKPESWNALVTMEFSLIAGTSGYVSTVSEQVNANYKNFVESGDITEIGDVNAGEKSILTCNPVQFTDKRAPSFRDTFPSFETGSGKITMTVSLDRAGTVYYVAAPVGVINTQTTTGAPLITTDSDGREGSTLIGRSYIPEHGTDRDRVKKLYDDETTRAQGDIIHFLTGDNNKKYNSPGWLTIYNGGPSNSRVKSGQIPVASGDITVDWDIIDLEPDTDYYIYIVLKGGGDADQVVQIYRQKTDPVKPPAVQIQAAGTTGATMTINDVEASTTGTYSSPMLYYTLVEYNSIPKDFLKYYNWRDLTAQEKTASETEDGWIDPRNIGSETKPDGASNTVMTVLDAMATTVSGKNGQTLFDVYGDDFGLKDYVYQYITSTTRDTYGFVPVERFNSGVRENPKTDDFYPKYIESETSQYVVLACARNEYTPATRGDSYGFAALSPLYYRDMDPPEYDGDIPLLQLTITKVMNGTQDITNNWRQASTDSTAHYDYTYSGTITVKFDKVVYFSEYIGQTNYRRPIWNATSGYTNENSTNNAISILEVIQGSAKLKCVLTKNEAKEANTFTLSFNGLVFGDYITISDLCNSNNQSNPSKKTLTLRFDPTLTYKDYDASYAEIAQPGFRVTWQ